MKRPDPLGAAPELRKGTEMDWLIWLGAAVSLLGLAGLVRCIVLALRARRAGLPEEELRARLQKVVALNMGALLVSALGLMMVILGITLG
jgi:hypothetical protein|tara:strand:+ start:2800 stop:3069 length:270 start_codon:yes stop_codon:yes gene_type:complete